VRFDSDGARATFRLPLGRLFALSDATAIALRVDRDVIAMRARMIPTLAATGAALFFPIIIMALSDARDPNGPRIVAPVVATLFVALQIVGALRSRRDFGPHAEAAMEAIEKRIAALG